ncbi:calcium-binding EF-hand family protein [Citrus sinensis]|uniref:Calcium-binding EF-hand family protein n=1 Tax=Citrus sinensis TaxID=2711 RepID=A0ACB8I7M0_CITSI|nr:calcium-binding EF-hand family protein [Citrus sinensis]
MEALSKVALAYYNSGTDEERRLFNLFFLSMDQDGNRRVSYREFSNFMSLEAHDDNMRTRDFFNQLDIDRSGGLDFKEVLTLYYILKSGRPICGQCKIFITNEYFTCMSCFEPQTAAYSICLECFCDKGRHDHNHGRSHFVDNFSLLESLRKKPLPNHQRSRSESSSHVAIARNNANIPAEGMFPWQAALRVFEAALPIANIIAACLIMRGLHTSNIFTEGGCSRTS